MPRPPGAVAGERDGAEPWTCVTELADDALPVGELVMVLAESRVRDRPVASLAVEATQLPGDVGIDTDADGQRIVQSAGVVDPHLRELASQLQLAARVARVEFRERDGDIEDRLELES